MFWIVSAKRWTVLIDWGLVCQGNIWNLRLARVEVWVPLNGTAMKGTGGKQSVWNSLSKRGRGVKASAQSLQYKDATKRPFVESVERIPLEPINRQRTHGFIGDVSPPPHHHHFPLPPLTAEDVQASAKEPVAGSGQNKRECWRNIS